MPTYLAHLAKGNVSFFHHLASVVRRLSSVNVSHQVSGAGSSEPIVSIFASQGLRFGSPFSPPLADLEYISRIRALIFHWLRLPVHVSNQKTFSTEHMLSRKCKQSWHRNALIWQRFATSRFGSNENIFPVCQSVETFTWLTVSASKLNLSRISCSSLGAAIFNSPTYV
jgi:hypothetical protein